jgi:WD40 repeat protein
MPSKQLSNIVVLRALFRVQRLPRFSARIQQEAVLGLLLHSAPHHAMASHAYTRLHLTHIRWLLSCAWQPINHVSFSPDGRLIASASFDKSVRIWNGITGKYMATLRGHVGAVYQVMHKPVFVNMHVMHKRMFAYI